MSWSDLDDVARSIMLIAAEEGMVWEACASWVPEPADRGVAEIDRTRESVTRLMELGLLRMYRISEGNPGLTAAEAMRVIDDRRRWVYDQGGAHDVALYLTDRGERVFGPTTA